MIFFEHDEVINEIERRAIEQDFQELNIP